MTTKLQRRPLGRTLFWFTNCSTVKKERKRDNQIFFLDFPPLPFLKGRKAKKKNFFLLLKRGERANNLHTIKLFQCIEILDFGYPQNCEPAILKTYIQGKTYNELALADVKQIVSGVTGAVNWRKQNIVYKKNELFIDVVEQCHVTMSQSGQVLNNYVMGKIIMKSFLSGMPDCKLGLNDKIMMQTEKKRGNGGSQKSKEISIDDVVFHQCVKLGKFETDRTINFIPPDGEFELMR